MSSDNSSVLSCSSDIDDVVCEADDIDNEVEEIRPVAASEVPALLQGLESPDQETWEKSATRLTQMVDRQQDLFIELLLSEVPRFLKLAQGTDNEDRRHALVDLCSQIAMSFAQGRVAIQEHLKSFVIFLLKSDPQDRFSVIRALEDMLSEDNTFESRLITAFREDIFTIPDDFNDSSNTFDHARYTSAAEVFQQFVLYQDELCRTAAAKANAVEFLINITGAPDPKTRAAAVASLGSALTCKSELQEHFATNHPDGNFENPNYFHGMLVLPVLGLLGDGDGSVARAVLQFLQEEDSEETKAFVCTDEHALCFLVLQLAKKIAFGDPVDWLLVRYSDADLTSTAEGFRKAWSSEDVSMETKIGIVKGLASNFDPVRRAAAKGGLAQFVLKGLDDVDHRSTLLSTVIAILDGDQVLGYRIIQAGGIPRLLDIFELGRNVEERCQAASILALLPQTYKPDDNDEDNLSSYREEATAALSADDILPRILAALDSDDNKIASAALTLLAETINSLDFNDDDAPSPIKDRIVDVELVDLAVSKLKVPETAPSALQLLSEICWTYQRGFDIVQDAFKFHIPQAGASFLAALYGESASRYISRKRHRVADAAVNAGGITRVLELLEKPIESAESCQVTVEALRVLLCANVADRDIGRKNTRLPVLLAHLIADASIESLQHVNWVVRLLSVDDDPKALANWSNALATEETVQHLIQALQTELVQFSPPDADTLSQEEYEKAAEEHKKKTNTEEERFTRTISVVVQILSRLLPVFAPFNDILAAAVLTRSNTCDESGVVELLNKLASSNSDEASLEPLIRAAKNLLALPTPPELSKLDIWLSSDSALATAFYLAGVVPFLLARSVPQVEHEDSDKATTNEIIEALVSLAGKVQGDVSRKRDVQKAFYENEKLLSVAIETLKNLEEYEKYTAQVMARSVFRLSQGYPEAVPLLAERDVFPSLLKMFNDEELDAELTGPLLGWLADVDKLELVNTLKHQIAQLKPPTNAGQGGKKKKKKGKYSPRISKNDVLLRLNIVSETSSTAREGVIDAGGLDLISEVLQEEGKNESWRLALQTLRCLIHGNGPTVHASIVSLLPRVAEIFKEESTEDGTYPSIFHFLQAYIDQQNYDIQPLIDHEWDLLLVKKLSEEPASVDDHSLLVKTLAAFIKHGDVTKKAVVERFRERIGDEDAWESEHSWGTTHALRCMADEGEDIAKAILELGALDYAVRLLNSDDLQYAIKGAALATTLARRSPADVLSAIEARGIRELAVAGKAKLEVFLQKPFESPMDTEESELEAAKEAHDEKQEQMADWVQHWDKFCRILGGETISDEEYEEYHWF